MKLPSESDKSKRHYIISNKKKYCISALCKLLKVSRSLVYYYLNRKESEISPEEDEIKKHIIDIFQSSKNNYGTRKIKVKLSNLVNRKFDDRDKLEVAVSDLTYVRVGNKWSYVCTLLDLSNREIMGYSVGKADLVKEAFLSCRYYLNSIRVFHSDIR